MCFKPLLAVPNLSKEKKAEATFYSDSLILSTHQGRQTNIHMFKKIIKSSTQGQMCPCHSNA